MSYGYSGRRVETNLVKVVYDGKEISLLEAAGEKDTDKLTVYRQAFRDVKNVLEGVVDPMFVKLCEEGFLIPAGDSFSQEIIERMKELSTVGVKISKYDEKLVYRSSLGV